MGTPAMTTAQKNADGWKARIVALSGEIEKAKKEAEDALASLGSVMAEGGRADKAQARAIEADTKLRALQVGESTAKKSYDAALIDLKIAEDRERDATAKKIASECEVVARELRKLLCEAKGTALRIKTLTAEGQRLYPNSPFNAIASGTCIGPWLSVPDCSIPLGLMLDQLSQPCYPEVFRERK